MAGNLDPDTIRTRTFSTGRRGFDRAEVEAFQAEVADLVAALRSRIDSTEANLAQLGITELPDLEVELGRVTDDIREVLQSAREAAEDMRVRAAADAESWRLEARHESAGLLDAAKAEAERLRREAWEASEAMLSSVTAETEEMQSKAGDDVLFIRAEAEKEALRHAGDAKRDADEMIKAAKEESEQLIAAATAKAAEVVNEAQADADLAQERVAALDGRRAELLEELEELRVELQAVEDRIEGRTAELTHAITDPSESSVRIIEEPDPAPMGEWLDDDATVRLIPPSSAAKPAPLLPVDADELVAEVESLRQVSPPVEPQPEALSGGSGSSAEDASLAFEIESGSVPVVADAAATAVVHSQPPDDATHVSDEPEQPDPVQPDPVEPKIDEPEIGEPEAQQDVAAAAATAADAADAAAFSEPAVDESAVAAEAPLPEKADAAEVDERAAVPVDPVALVQPAEPVVEPPVVPTSAEVDELDQAKADEDAAAAPEAAGDPDPVDDLFARLRTPSTAASRGTAAAEQPDVSAEPESAEATPPNPPSSASFVAESDSEQESPHVEPVAPATQDSAPDPWQARNEALLPITNQALREVKRQIVDVQNSVLEDLRTQPSGWRPERSVFAPVEQGEVAEIEERCAAAGFTAAAVATGRDVDYVPSVKPPGDSVGAMLDDLWRDVVDAIATAESDGPRQTNAAVGRIFRAWRTDEAERRLQTLARSVYNAAAAAHCDAAGVAFETHPAGRSVADAEAVVVPVS